jgi:hypothetical protein
MPRQHFGNTSASSVVQAERSMKAATSITNPKTVLCKLKTCQSELVEDELYIERYFTFGLKCLALRQAQEDKCKMVVMKSIEANAFDRLRLTEE